MQAVVIETRSYYSRTTIPGLVYLVPKAKSQNGCVPYQQGGTARDHRYAARAMHNKEEDQK